MNNDSNQEILELIEQILDHNDEYAITTLYNMTSNEITLAVKSMVKDADAVQDIVQDSYVKAFTHLVQLENGYQFVPWLKRIAQNTARDWLKKKQPILFSEINADSEEEFSFEDRLVDENPEHMPEVVLDREETARLMNEILSRLSEDQQMVVALYYREQWNIREIAAFMGFSESKVKSMLFQARKKIEEGVLDLEKKGTKLYGFSPILLLLLLFRSEKAYAADAPASGQVLANVLNKAATANAVKKAAAAGFALKPGMIAGIGIVAIAAASVGIGAAFAKSKVAEQEIAEQEVVLEDIEMEAPKAEPTPEPEKVEEPEPVVDEDLDVYAEYNRILDEVDSLDFKIVDVGNITGYEYALVQMEPEDELETLLVAENTEYNRKYIRLFQYVPSIDTLYAPDDADDVVQQEQVMVEIMADGHGLSEGFLGGQGYSSQYRITFAEDHKHLNRTETASFRIGESGSFLDQKEIDWYPVSDRSLLPSGSLSSDSENADDSVEVAPKKSTKSRKPAKTKNSSSAQNNSAQNNSAQLPTDGNRTVLRGTLQAFSYDQVISWQGMADPNPPTAEKQASTYYIITFDQKISLTANSVDGLWSSQTKGIYLRDQTAAGSIGLNRVGTDIIFSIDPNTTYWPSDTSIPMGTPTTSDIHLLG